MPRGCRAFFLLLGLATLSFTALWAQVGWDTYGGDAGGQRYSGAAQITPQNVGKLAVAWQFDTHAMDTKRLGASAAAFEATPILFKRKLYFDTPFDVAFALDALTGKQIWTFDSQVQLVGEHNITTSRGVALWNGGGGSEACADRVFMGTLDGRLIAVDAATGKRCVDFGKNGEVDLTADTTHKPFEVYSVTSAPTVLGDVVVVGSSLPDSQRVREISGKVHAYDVRSGKLLWTYDPIASWAQQQPDARRTGAANVWSTISADPKLGYVYLPVGSSSPDHFGGTRPGDNRDANSVVALEAKTGKRVWGFQVVHHDLWDYDVAAEPLLFQWQNKVPAVAIGTKMGQVFVLDRRTGVPLVPVEERPVPKSDVAGEVASPTQPFSALPNVGSIDAHGMTFSGTSKSQQECAEKLKGLRYEGIFTPPTLRGTLEYPGVTGGINWGGMAYDPQTQSIYANANSDVLEINLISRAEVNQRVQSNWPWSVRFLFWTAHYRRVLGLAAIILVCGALLRRGLPPWPAWALALVVLLVFPLRYLLEWNLRRTNYDPNPISYVHHGNASRGDDYSPQEGTPYWMHRVPLVDSTGHGCAPLPWGSLTAIDLQTGKLRFRVRHGHDVAGQPTGNLTLSGPTVTAGGLVFSAGSSYPALYSYDAKTGERLAELPLPFPAQASPMSYSLDGKQFVVIAAGGHGLFGTKQGSEVVAFALPGHGSPAR